MSNNMLLYLLELTFRILPYHLGLTSISMSASCCVQSLFYTYYSLFIGLQ